MDKIEPHFSQRFGVFYLDILMKHEIWSDCR